MIVIFFECSLPTVDTSSHKNTRQPQRSLLCPCRAAASPLTCSLLLYLRCLNFSSFSNSYYQIVQGTAINAGMTNSWWAHHCYTDRERGPLCSKQPGISEMFTNVPSPFSGDMHMHRYLYSFSSGILFCCHGTFLICWIGADMELSEPLDNTAWPALVLQGLGLLVLSSAGN